LGQRGRSDTRGTAVLARTRSDKLPGCVQHLVADFVERTAQSDTAWKIVVQKNCGMERRIVYAGLHRGADVAAIAHQKNACQMGQRVCQTVKTVQTLA